jgi:hypothetical protein
MAVHTFTLILRSPREINRALEDAVYDAGCGDAALGQRAGVVYLEFDREARFFVDAVLSAIRDVHSAPEIHVSHVEPDELVTASEIADRTGRTRESVRLLVEGARGPGGFPPPVSGTRKRRARLWRWSQVAEWLETHGLTSGRRDEARVIVAVNGALDLSRNADDGARDAILAAVRKPV